jgi:hypothetical protein
MMKMKGFLTLTYPLAWHYPPMWFPLCSLSFESVDEIKFDISYTHTYTLSCIVSCPYYIYPDRWRSLLPAHACSPVGGRRLEEGNTQMSDMSKGWTLLGSGRSSRPLFPLTLNFGERGRRAFIVYLASGIGQPTPCLLNDVNAGDTPWTWPFSERLVW